MAASGGPVLAHGRFQMAQFRGSQEGGMTGTFSARWDVRDSTYEYNMN